MIFHGDFHGDIRSFISTLEWLNRSGRMSGFRIKRPNTYLVFLGDYTDRGAYGVEVIYTLLRLKLANPKRVFFVRGNHEDFQLTARYGFLREVRAKYGRTPDAAVDLADVRFPAGGDLCRRRKRLCSVQSWWHGARLRPEAVAQFGRTTAFPDAGRTGPRGSSLPIIPTGWTGRTRS
ncbi:MAG: hypothetical protein CM1200mP2_05400 [Planctomycetaceae bacterium]|nr:MAG: hypothetical protein CM1200mP2_05400 [Planctomycetaceae bacterium]